MCDFNDADLEDWFSEKERRFVVDFPTAKAPKAIRKAGARCASVCLHAFMCMIAHNCPVLRIPASDADTLTRCCSQLSLYASLLNRCSNGKGRAC